MTRIITTLISLSSLLLLSSGIMAQSAATLRGQLIDQDAAAVSFANIALYNAKDSSLITGTVSDMDGKFEFRTTLINQPLRMVVSAIGFEKVQREFTLTAAEVKDFGKLALIEDSKVLNAVTVKSMRPIIEMEPDKLVVTVEGTALAEGNTAFDVLERSPGVFVDQNGGIQLNGKQGVLVMIDDRQTYMSATELRALLESMPASNIRNIELITNPSAKYDAEGVAGIINIQLKKNHMVGMNGSIYAGNEYNRYYGYNGGFNINYKKDKFNTFLNVDYARRNNYRDNGFERSFEQDGIPTHMSQVGEWRFTNHVPSVRMGLDYDINDKHSVGFTVRGTFLNALDDFSMQTDFRQIGEPTMLINSENLINKSFINLTSNLHYIAKLDSLGRKISVDLDFANMNQTNNATFDNHFRLESGELLSRDQMVNFNPVNYDIFALRSDYVHPLKDGKKLELGIKASRVVSDNNLRFEGLTDSGWEPLAHLSNHFIYTEHILAGYANYSAKLSPAWVMKAGLRAEQTYADGYSVTLDSTNFRSYLDLFPSVFLQQNVSDKYQLTYSYSRRINRPNYESLNPFMFFIDPYTFASGNPNLNPSYSQVVEFTQTFHRMFNLTAGYTLTQGIITEVPFFDEETNATILMASNFEKVQNVSLRAIAPIPVKPWWQMQTVVVGNYNEVFATFGSDVIQQGLFSVYAQLNNSFSLPQRIRLELNGTYMSPQVFGPFWMDQLWRVDAGFKKSFLDNKLDVSINGMDLFRGMQFNGRANFQGQQAVINQYNGLQSIRMTVRYKFNKGTKFEAPRRNGGIEEISRTGSN
jgi:hypothetical protein